MDIYFSDMETFEYDEDTLNHLKNVELMILKDFIKICEDNNLTYFAYAGTALGAVRHNGFIPWDDDVDVLMLREDYEKFLKIMETEMTDKYEIINDRIYDDFFMAFSKLNLKGTYKYEPLFQNSKFNNGISIDIFAFDYIPNNKFKRKICMKIFKTLKHVSNMFNGDYNRFYKSKFIKFSIDTIMSILKIFKIDYTSFKNLWNYSLKKFSNEKTEHITELVAIPYFESMPSKIFDESIKVKFEDIELNLPKDYDKFLTITYGDYMELPPEEERKCHGYGNIDFGKY